ncbi:MAG: heavy metal translocating P-type ATPase [Gammaproteobacteria bacterium]
MSATPCYHCGAPVPARNPPTTAVAGKLQTLCSEACARTAALIEKRGLTEFYRFRDGPAHTASSRDGDRQRWLPFDRQALQNEFVVLRADGLREAHLLLQGVRCAACTWLIENALGAAPGLKSISGDPLTTRATLCWDPERVALSELLTQLARLGYTPVPYTEDATELAARQERRLSLQRLIVAGLGMMQVMSFAVALYLGAWRDPQIESYLRLISLLVSTPVVFYAGAPFFFGAWAGIRGGALGMDVPVALAVGGAWCASVWNTLVGSGEVYFDSATMFVFFLSAARFLEMTGRHRAMSLTGAMAQHLPRVATRLQAGLATQVGVMELEKGDRILVAPGETLPADGELLSDRARVDEALLTGESRPVSRGCGDTLVAGSLNTDQVLEMTVVRVGADTLMAQIARLVGDAGDRKPRLVEIADRVASWFVATVLLAAAAVAYVWWQLAPERAFEIALAVLVVTCPCALALATPAAFTVATTSLARLGFMVRRRGALQNLSRLTDVVFDKTGTLTDAQPVIADIQTWRNCSADQARSIAAALESRSSHPLAKAFPAAAALPPVNNVEAISGAGLEGTVDGQRYRIGTEAFVTAWTTDSGTVVDNQAARRQVFLGDTEGLLARFSVAEHHRDGAAEVTGQLATSGLDLRIFSGDQAGPVSALADSLGIRHWQAALQPQEKLAAVEQLQAQGRIVAMVGDGINDSPVLAGADVSIAMGSGTSLAQHSADCVLMSESLAPLWSAREVARRTLRVVRQNVAWAVAYNLVALPLAATGLLAPWMAALGMSASSLLVTGNALRLARLPVSPEASSAASTFAAEPRAACCKKPAGAAS